MNITTIPLSSLKAKQHPEVSCSRLAQAIQQVRGQGEGLAIMHQGAPLAFMLPTLPDSIANSDVDLASHPLTTQSLTPGWFNKPAGAWQCTRHGRFCCWMVKPELAAHFLPVEVPTL